MPKIALFEKIKYNGYYFCLSCRAEFSGSNYIDFKTICPICGSKHGIDYVELEDVIRLNKKEIVNSLELVFHQNKQVIVEL